MAILWIALTVILWMIVGSALALFMGKMINLRDRRG